MSPWQRKLRRALGSVKDQTTIGLAKVVGAMAPELEVALVKATSHDKFPVEEKHVQEVIFLTSTSRAYTMACVSHLSRRLSRTQNWMVAVKALMLIHRLLRDGYPAFEQELLRESRAGGHVLNLSGFQDDSVTSGWEYSAFVRTYALYLDELLDYNASNRAFFTDDGRPSSSSNSSFGRRSGSDTYGSINEEHGPGCSTLAFKEMRPQELLERMPLVQRMLERVLACHPAGNAKMDRLIQTALDLIVKDSFQFYASICDGLAIILGAFFEMKNAECAKAFEIQTVAAKQAEALDIFYGFFKDIGGCRLLDYPYVQRIPEELLETMEGFLRDILMKASMDKQERGSKELRKLKAIPAPPLTQAISTPTQQEQPTEPSLLDISQSTLLAEEQAKSSALASFADTNALAWETFDKVVLPQTSAGTLEEERPANGWELALLVASTNPTPEPSSFVKAGGFNCLLVDRLQEQAFYSQRPLLSIPFGSASSSTMHSNPSSLLALPAPEIPPREDPFVASSSIPPPPYVQMSDMKQKQELLLLEQQLWEQYQRNGMQGQNGLAKLYDGGFNGALQPFLSAPFLH